MQLDMLGNWAVNQSFPKTKQAETKCIEQQTNCIVVIPVDIMNRIPECNGVIGRKNAGTIHGRKKFK
jgi:hypothetical protein